MATRKKHTPEQVVRKLATADRMLNEGKDFDRLAVNRGYPSVLRCDNGPELACAAMADWAGERVGLHFIPPGQPRRNGYIGRSTAACATNASTQHVLVTGSGAGGDQRVEGGLQPPPATLVRISSVERGSVLLIE